MNCSAMSTSGLSRRSSVPVLNDSPIMPTRRLPLARTLAMAWSMWTRFEASTLPCIGSSTSCRFARYVVARFEELEVLHVHYAIPHPTSAYLARQILFDSPPRIVTTLHGTDITLVGNDPSFLPITRFSIAESDA